ncbi:MAG: hypothetical protein MJZ21_04960, partial [archaeon]|nr:hypothetical protein [archaeon]
MRIQMQNVNFGYTHDKLILHDINLDLEGPGHGGGRVRALGGPRGRLVRGHVRLGRDGGGLPEVQGRMRRILTF